MRESTADKDGSTDEDGSTKYPFQSSAFTFYDDFNVNDSSNWEDPLPGTISAGEWTPPLGEIYTASPSAIMFADGIVEVRCKILEEEFGVWIRGDTSGNPATAGYNLNVFNDNLVVRQNTNDWFGTYSGTYNDGFFHTYRFAAVGSSFWAWFDDLLVMQGSHALTWRENPVVIENWYGSVSVDYIGITPFIPGLVAVSEKSPEIYGSDALNQAFEPGNWVISPNVSAAVELTELQPGYSYYYLRYHWPDAVVNEYEYRVVLDCVEVDGRYLDLVAGGHSYSGSSSHPGLIPREIGAPFDGLHFDALVTAEVNGGFLTIILVLE